MGAGAGSAPGMGANVGSERSLGAGSSPVQHPHEDKMSRLTAASGRTSSWVIFICNGG